MSNFSAVSHLDLLDVIMSMVFEFVPIIMLIILLYGLIGGV